MNCNNEYAYTGIRIIFMLISVFLMFPIVWDGGINYYRTLFIFLFGKIIDLFFLEPNERFNLFTFWNIINQIIGTIACAFSFCAMIPDFFNLFKKYTIQVNIILMICIVSYTFKDLMKFIILTVKRNSSHFSNNT